MKINEANWALVATITLLVVNLSQLVSADWRPQGCARYSVGGVISQPWGPIENGNFPDLLSCSVHCQDAYPGTTLFGKYDTLCVCGTGTGPMTSASTASCKHFEGGSSQGNQFVTAYRFVADQPSFTTTNEAITDSHEYHAKGCYRFHNLQQGTDGSHNSLFNPFYNTQAQTDRIDSAKSTQECAVACSQHLEGLFGIYDNICFCQNYNLVPEASVAVPMSFCENDQNSEVSTYNGGGGTVVDHQYYYMKLYKFVQATNQPTTTSPVSHSCKRNVGPNNKSGPNNKNNCYGEDNQAGPNNKYGPNNKSGPNNKYGPNNKKGPDNKSGKNNA